MSRIFLKFNEIIINKQRLCIKQSLRFPQESIKLKQMEIYDKSCEYNGNH